MSRMSRRHPMGSRVTTLAILCVLVALSTGSAVASDSTADRTKPRPILKVNVTIKQAPESSPGSGASTLIKAFFSENPLNVGPVIFVVRNFTGSYRTLVLDGVSSRPMGPDGGTAVMRVTFKRPGIYIVGVGSTDVFAQNTGEIRVIR